MYESIIDGNEAMSYLEELCALPTNMDRAIYMQEEFEKLGLETETEKIDYYNTEDINVYASYRGDPDSERYVVVMAHHDKVSGSPGANDNGSGSVALLELAESYVKNNDKINILFASFGAEEKGLIGSRQYSAKLTEKDKEEIIGGYNLDCIGNGSDLVIITGDYYGDTDPYLNSVIHETAESLGIDVADREIRFGTSDHASLIKAGVPATMLARMEGYSIPDIHTPEDKVENINVEEFVEAIDLSYYVIKEIYERDKQ